MFVVDSIDYVSNTNVVLLEYRNSLPFVCYFIAVIMTNASLSKWSAMFGGSQKQESSWPGNSGTRADSVP